MVDRDRDAHGRPQNARPRDELGRPLPRGALGTARVPEDLILPPAEALREAQRLLDHGLPFHAHEVLEGTWKNAAAEERELWQGLAQLAVGLTHLRRGNVHGATTLISRFRRRISRYLDHPPYRIDAAGLLAWSDGVLALLAQTSPELDSIAPPRLLNSVVVAEGGEAVCWLDRVCPACGGLDEQAGPTCLQCGAVIRPHPDSS